MLKTTKLTKNFGDNKGIFNAQIEIQAGEIAGLIGPNGAGKSTLINCLTGLYYPTSGSFELFEKSANPLNIHQFLPKMGIMLSEIKELANLKAGQILNRYYELQKDNLSANLEEGFNFKQEIDRLSELLEIQTNKPFSKLSLGNKKKISIIKTLAHRPKLIILDEPTSGLDPLIQKKLFSELLAVKNRGGSVFLSSHVLKEVEDICDRIIMVKNGKIISQDSTQDLLAKSYKIVQISSQFQPQIQTLIKSIPELEKEIKIEIVEGKINIKTHNILPFLDLAKTEQIQDLLITKPSLEELFLERY